VTLFRKKNGNFYDVHHDRKPEKLPPNALYETPSVLPDSSDGRNAKIIVL
jgi:hypothetical protein